MSNLLSVYCTATERKDKTGSDQPIPASPGDVLEKARVDSVVSCDFTSFLTCCLYVVLLLRSMSRLAVSYLSLSSLGL